MGKYKFAKVLSLWLAVVMAVNILQMPESVLLVRAQETEAANEDSSYEENSLEESSLEGADDSVGDRILEETAGGEEEGSEASDQNAEEPETEESREQQSVSGNEPEGMEGIVCKSENAVSLTKEIWVEGFLQEDKTLVYTGKEVKQDLSVYHNGTLLKEGTDYKLFYENNINAGCYDDFGAPSVKISMMGQYQGSQTLYYTILPLDLAVGCTYEEEQAVSYQSYMTFFNPAIRHDGILLSYNKDYVCECSRVSSGTEDDKYTYTVTGKGNYTGSVTISVYVTKDKNKNLSLAKVTLDKEEYLFCGTPLTADAIKILSVKIGNKKVVQEYYEYEVYASAPGAGSIKIRPTALGKEAGYAGVKVVSFRVAGDRKLSDADMGDNWQECFIYSKKEAENGICQSQTGLLVYGRNREELTEGVDYTVSFLQNKKVGVAKAVFTGMGRYTGTLEKTYRIEPDQDLIIQWDDTDADQNPVVKYAQKDIRPSFSLFEKDGSLLAQGTDYTVSYTYDTGNVFCKIVGKGNYKGYAVTQKVKIVSGDISLGEMSVSDRVYEKEEWRSPVVIRDQAGNTLKAGVDYESELIYTYEDMEEGKSPSVGTLITVTAQGTGHFEGSKITAQYRICAAKLSGYYIRIEDQEYTGQEVELAADDIHFYSSVWNYRLGKEVTPPTYEIVSYENNKNVGKAEVTLKGTGEYGAEKTVTFRIVKKKYAPEKVSSLVLNTTEAELGIGSSCQLTAEIFPEEAENKTILWSSSNYRVATVDKNGRITAKKEGTVKITAKSQDGGAKAVCKITVKTIPVTSFTLSKDKITGCENSMYQLEVSSIEPENASKNTILWESTNENIAKVDENGLVSLQNAGMAVVSAKAMDGNCVRKCIVIVEKENESKPDGDYLTPQMYKLAKDTDDTMAFIRAIRALRKGEYSTVDTLYVPAGTYAINAQLRIQVENDDITIRMSEDAVLEAIGNSGTHSDVIEIKGRNNVTITGGTIKGERYAHSGTSGEWGMGIGIYDSSNITVDHVSISNCWGDGIYIGSNKGQAADAGCSNITIQNCALYNNRRNNLSIVAGKDITIESCRFEYANGTSPEYGIDIETNYSDRPCERIKILNSTFTGNGQAALGIITAADDILVQNCILNGDFINYAGTNVTLSGTTVYGELCARIGISMTDGTVVNDGTQEEDVLVADFAVTKDSYSFGKYNVDADNPMSAGVEEDTSSSTGKKITIKRTGTGTKEAGFYLDLSELTDGEHSVLKPEIYYRFEYSIKGSGTWGMKTSQTAWYPIVLLTEKYVTGATAYQAKASSACKLFFYALDTGKDAVLDLEWIKIYEVK